MWKGNPWYIHIAISSLGGYLFELDIDTYYWEDPSLHMRSTSCPKSTHSTRKTTYDTNVVPIKLRGDVCPRKSGLAYNNFSMRWDVENTLPGINFMKPFTSSFGYTYILVTLYYVSKWVEAIASKANDIELCSNSLREIWDPKELLL